MNKCLLEECQNLTSNPKFCSLSCGAKHQQRNKIRPVRTRLCAREDCGKEFAVTVGKYENQYCSRSCSATVNNKKFPKRESTKIQKAPRKSKAQMWLDGEWDGTVQTGLSNAVRNFLIAESGGRCTSPTCAVPGGFAEINPVTGRCPLEVDHLDGNCYNNSRENLMVVCPNCHALTPTYRALNKGSGRAYRRTA